MPWYNEPRKDAYGGDTRRGGAKKPSIRRFPNEETQHSENCATHCFTVNSNVKCQKSKLIKSPSVIIINFST